MPLQLNLAMTPLEIASAATLPEKIAWMACHFSPDGKGLTNLPQQLQEDSMLILDDSISWCGQRGDEIVEALHQLIVQFRYSSLLLDFQRPFSKEMFHITSAVIEALPCPVGVTPEYAKELPCPVFLPPSPLHIPLQKYLNKWKDREVWLEVGLCREQVVVTKDGTQCKQNITVSPYGGYFSDQLCCRYATNIQSDHITFTLFDTPETLQNKLELAQSHGVAKVVGLYQELGTFLLGRDFNDHSIV